MGPAKKGSSVKYLQSMKTKEHLISYALESSINIENAETYILHLVLNHQVPNFAVSLSNQTIKLFNIETKTNIAICKDHEKTISGLKYSKVNPDLLYSSSEDGNIRLWDTRDKENLVRTFIDDSDGPLKPILSFDFSLDENYISGGTEVIREDAFIVFWDSRTSKNLGGYWNSHTDDITQVKYHPHKNCILASGSVDGLINIFDLSHSCEDDALTHTLNTNSSVASLTWNAKPYGDINEDRLFCLTHTEDIQAWKISESSYYLSLDREALTNNDTKSTGVDYLIDVLQDDEQAYVVSGHRSGKLHIWSINDCDTKLWAQIENAHKTDVRAVDWHYNDQILFTGGEDGTVCIWKSAAHEKLKVPSGVQKSSSKKPY